MLDDFAEENEQISRRVGNYATMNFEDIYKPKYYPKNDKAYKQIKN
jgi:hypothetical protein